MSRSVVCNSAGAFLCIYIGCCCAPVVLSLLLSSVVVFCCRCCRCCCRLWLCYWWCWCYDIVRVLFFCSFVGSRLFITWNCIIFMNAAGSTVVVRGLRAYCRAPLFLAFCLVSTTTPKLSTGSQSIRFSHPRNTQPHRLPRLAHSGRTSSSTPTSSPHPPPAPPFLFRTRPSSARGRGNLAVDGAGVSGKQGQASLPHAEGPRGHAGRAPRRARLLGRHGFVPPTHSGII